MNDKNYCGIIFIGTGSSWSWGSTPEEAAQKAAKQCKRDWRSMFEFKRQQPFKVNVIDMREREGWYADYRGIMDNQTHEEIPIFKVIEETA